MAVRIARVRLPGLLLQAFAATLLANGDLDGEVAYAGDVGSDDSSLLSTSSTSSVKSSLQAEQMQGWERMCAPAMPGANDHDDECVAKSVCESEHRQPLSALSDWAQPPAMMGAAMGKTCRVECHADKSGKCFFGNSTQCRGGQCKQVCIRAPHGSGICITGWCLKGGNSIEGGCEANNCVSNTCYDETTPVCFSPADFGCHSPINCFVIHWKKCSDCHAAGTPQPTPHPTPKPTPKPRGDDDDDDDDDKDDDDDDKDKDDDDKDKKDDDDKDKKDDDDKDKKDDDDKDKKDDDDKDKKDDDDKDKKDDDDKDKKDDDDKDKKDDDDKDKKDDDDKDKKDSRRRRGGSRRRSRDSRRRGRDSRRRGRDSRRRGRDSRRRGHDSRRRDYDGPYGSVGSAWRGWGRTYDY